MCGRYTIEKVKELKDYYGVELPPDVKPNYNAAPTQTMPVIKDGKEISLMKWGFRPFWMKDKAVGYSLFNTKSEDAFHKSTWSKSMRERRCVIPVSAFYEWKAEKDGKHPFYIYLKDQPFLSLAGIWGTFDIDGIKQDCFSILTTSPNEEMAPIHNRMPVILHNNDIKKWLNPDTSEEEDLEGYMKPFDDGKLIMYEVSKDVNVVKNNYDQLIVPLHSK